ncbi:dolichyl-phosphate beta-glucosyltransferase [Gossypium hirsutum]|uniref:Dolichyl-phosphate beta-glucosyltransferase n=1 Tax=Gossypium hirsutum TaxID=3635 RepID=A0ABM2YNI7_GOSHI|nr:dolichyl-phosphate beta-glucosyltransferase [Gossypium hirsutum]
MPYNFWEILHFGSELETAAVRNCLKNNQGFEGGCVARFLGRLSFEPLKENPLFGPSSNTIVKQGMLHSRGELLLMLDADGASKVTDLEKLENQIHAIVRKDYHPGDSVAGEATFRISDIPIVAFGSRAHHEEKALATRKWYRNFLMKGFHLVVLLAAGPGIRDTQCGFKMFTRFAARKLFTNIRLKRWCFDVEIVFLCKWFGIPMLEISVNWSEIPGSKVNPLSIPNMLWELALMSVGYRTRIWKINS